MNNIIFKLNRAGGADILRNNPTLASLQTSAMQQVLADVQAQFFQTFGVEGHFELRQTLGDRRGVTLVPTSKQTRAVLNTHPGWLSTYMNNIKI